VPDESEESTLVGGVVEGLEGCSSVELGSRSLEPGHDAGRRPRESQDVDEARDKE
jgi:hypothetical protein